MILEIEIANEMENGHPRKQGSAFLEKLYDMLEDKSYEDYICWCADGTTVLVKKVEEFSQIVLPKFYKHNNFQSFVRQLNMYSFNKTSHDANWREFKQPLFRRGMRNLLGFISRKTQQKNPPTTTAPASDTTANGDAKARQTPGLGSVGTDQESVGSGTGSDTSLRKVRSTDVKRVRSLAPDNYSIPATGVPTQMAMNRAIAYSGRETMEIAALRNDMMVLQSRVSNLEGQLQYVISYISPSNTAPPAGSRPTYVPFSRTHHPSANHHHMPPTRYRETRNTLGTLSSGDESPEESNSMSGQSSVSSGSDTSDSQKIKKTYSLSDIPASNNKDSVASFVRTNSVQETSPYMVGVKGTDSQSASTDCDSLKTAYSTSFRGGERSAVHNSPGSDKQGVNAILSAAEGLVQVSHTAISPQREGQVNHKQHQLTESAGLTETNVNSRRQMEMSEECQPYAKRMRSASDMTVSSSSSGTPSSTTTSQYEGRYLSKMTTMGK